MVIEKGASFWVIFKLFLLMLPFTAALTIPMGLLFGILLAFGRFSSNSEIIAMRSSGISIYSIFKPAFYFGLAVTFIMFLFTNYIMPETNHHYKVLWKSVLYSNPSIALRDRVFTEVPNSNKKISALSTSRDGNEMTSVFISEFNRQEGNVKITYAQGGHWENNEPNSPLITLVLNDGVTMGVDIDDPESLEHLKFEKFTINIKNSVHKINETRGLREVSAFNIHRQIKKKTRA